MLQAAMTATEWFTSRRPEQRARTRGRRRSRSILPEAAKALLRDRWGTIEAGHRASGRAKHPDRRYSGRASTDADRVVGGLIEASRGVPVDGRESADGGRGT